MRLKVDPERDKNRITFFPIPIVAEGEEHGWHHN